jgi:hypothetical protein
LIDRRKSNLSRVILADAFVIANEKVALRRHRMCIWEIGSYPAAFGNDAEVLM